MLGYLPAMASLLHCVYFTMPSNLSTLPFVASHFICISRKVAGTTVFSDAVFNSTRGSSVEKLSRKKQKVLANCKVLLSFFKTSDGCTNCMYSPRHVAAAQMSLLFSARENNVELWNTAAFRHSSAAWSCTNIVLGLFIHLLDVRSIPEWRTVFMVLRPWLSR